MSCSTVRRQSIAMLAIALLAGACAGASPSGSAGPSVVGSAPASDGPATPSAAPSASVTASLSTTEPPAASLAVEGGDPVTGQLGTFTWGDGGSDSPWLPGSPIAVGTGERLTVSIAGAVGGGHLVRQTDPRGSRRMAPGRPVSERVARRSPSTPRRPGRGRSR